MSDTTPAPSAPESTVDTLKTDNPMSVQASSVQKRLYDIHNKVYAGAPAGAGFSVFARAEDLAPSNSAPATASASTHGPTSTKLIRISAVSDKLEYVSFCLPTSRVEGDIAELDIRMTYEDELQKSGYFTAEYLKNVLELLSRTASQAPEHSFADILAFELADHALGTSKRRCRIRAKDFGEALLSEYTGLTANYASSTQARQVFPSKLRLRYGPGDEDLIEVEIQKGSLFSSGASSGNLASGAMRGMDGAAMG